MPFSALPAHGRSDAGVGNTPLPVAELADVQIPAEADWSLDGTILTPSAGEWDARFAGPSPGSALLHDGTYWLYYVGADGDRSSDSGPRHRAVGLATCAATDDPTDPSNWTKHASNPVVSYDDLQNNNAEEEGAWGVAAYVDGDEILLYVADLVGSGGNVNGDIRLFTSTDGLNFTDQGIVIDHTSAFPGDDECTPIGVYVDAGGTWHLYYVAKGGDTFWDVAHASGPARDNFTSAEVIRPQDSTGSAHRYGGDVVVLRDNDSGVKIGLAVCGQDGEFEVISFTDDDFSGDTFETNYDWGTQGSSLILDRDRSRWVAFHNQNSDDNASIEVRTAAVVEV